MASTDGERGIKLKDFLEMWTRDGTRLVQQERRDINGAAWYLSELVELAKKLEADPRWPGKSGTPVGAKPKARPPTLSAAAEVEEQKHQ